MAAARLIFGESTAYIELERNAMDKVLRYYKANFDGNCKMKTPHKNLAKYKHLRVTMRRNISMQE
jgi:hypothetical protein